MQLNDMSKISRIARKVLAGYGENQYIDKELLDASKEELGKYAEQFDTRHELYGYDFATHDGRSFDGYMSHTEGDCCVFFPIDGYAIMSIQALDDIASEQFKACDSSFVFDFAKLFDERAIDGYGVLEDLSQDDKIKLVHDDVECPDDIKSEYEKYCDKWNNDQYGYLVFEVQFRHNRETEWTICLYCYDCDTYLKDRHYHYQEYVSFAPGDDPTKMLKQEIARMFAAIK